jgi:hypothetical protein
MLDTAGYWMLDNVRQLKLTAILLKLTTINI